MTILRAVTCLLAHGRQDRLSVSRLDRVCGQGMLDKDRDHRTSGLRVKSRVSLTCFWGSEEPSAQRGRVAAHRGGAGGETRREWRKEGDIGQAG